MADGIKVKVNFTELKKFFKKSKVNISSAKGAKAGYFEGKRYADTKSGQGLELARNALIQEKGDPIHNIPPRPFLSNAVYNYQSKWRDRFLRDIKNGIPFEIALKRVGLLMQNSIADQIDNTLTPANKPSTIARKGSSHPLIDTGRLKNSVSSEVIK